MHDYNFVLTKKWMFLVLRREPHLNGIHCNSLGYLGLLFVKDEEKKELLESKLKPIELLASLAMPTYGNESINQSNSFK